jgi:hypothetical protein
MAQPFYPLNTSPLNPESGRFIIDNAASSRIDELTSGARVEMQIGDAIVGGRVEYDHDTFQAYCFIARSGEAAITIPLREGMLVRRP